jgi:hyaluronate lyase
MGRSHSDAQVGMRVISRRDTLRAAAALALTAGASISRGAGTAQSDDAFDVLRRRWVTMLTGDSLVDAARPPYSGIVRDIASTASQWWSSMASPGSDPTSLWSDPASGSGEYNSRVSADRLRVMALAWATPGSELAGSATLLSDLLAALEWFGRRRYSVLIERYGNWWEWEIGIPLAVVDLLLILHVELMTRAPALQARLTAAIERFTPAPAVGTAANRVWRSHIVLLNAIVARKEPALSVARATLPTTFGDVDRGDGFHRDGSFIQHDDLAYNGGYGREMLIRTALLAYLLEGSKWRLEQADVARLTDRVATTFAPFMYRGAMMDAVRGRNVSRINVSDVASGKAVIYAVLYLASVAKDAGLRDMAAGWIAGLPASYSFFTYVPALPSYWLTPHIAWLAEQAIAAGTASPDLVGTFAFADMDRFVHRRPGFALSVAMNSARIANYESLNEENLTGWYQGSGVTMVYTRERPNYADDYWPTVDPYRLPGVTLDHRLRPLAAPVARNASAAVGTLAYAGAGIAAMRVSTDSNTFGARKCWVTAGDVVIAMGAGITSEAPEPVATVLFNQPIAAEENGLIVDGKHFPLDAQQSQVDVRSWLVVPGLGGFVLPVPTKIEAAAPTRAGAWSAINRQGESPGDLRSKKYLTGVVNHGVRPQDSTYFYTMLPGAGATVTRDFANAGGVTCIQNSAALQAVEIKGASTLIHAYIFWEAGACEDGIEADGAALVLISRSENQVSVSVQEPLQRSEGHLVLTIPWKAQIISGDPAMTLHPDSSALKISIGCRDLRGRTATATFSS